MSNRDASFTEFPNAKTGGVGTLSLSETGRAVDTSRTRVRPASILLPDARSGNDAVFVVGEGSAIADGETTRFFIDKLFSASSATSDGLREDGTLTSLDTFADR